MGTAYPDLVENAPPAAEDVITRIAVVTGPAERAAAVSQALKDRGFHLSWAGEHDWLGDETMPLARSSADCYVQLPTGQPQDTGGVSGLRSLISGSILPRFDAVAAVLPMLRSGASVVLVAGEGVRQPGLAEPCARQGLLRTLARAIAADRADIRAIVVARDRSCEEIAEIARRGGIPLRWPPEIAAAHAPELDLSSWREEIMSFLETDLEDSIGAGFPGSPLRSSP